MPLSAIRFGQAQVQKGKPIQCLKRFDTSNLEGQIFVPHQTPGTKTLVYSASDGIETHLIDGHWYNSKGKLVRSHSYASFYLKQGVSGAFTDISSWKPRKSLSSLTNWITGGIKTFVFVGRYRRK